MTHSDDSWFSKSHVLSSRPNLIFARFWKKSGVSENSKRFCKSDFYINYYMHKHFYVFFILVWCWTLRAAHQKYLESFEMWCWRRMEKISWTDHVRNEEVLLRVNEQRNILHEIRKRKANLIGHILRRNCLLKQVIEGKIKGEMEVTRRWGIRRKKLLNDLKDRRGYSHLKKEALDRTMWRNRFGGGFGPVVRQNTEWMNGWSDDGPLRPELVANSRITIKCYIVVSDGVHI